MMHSTRRFVVLSIIAIAIRTSPVSSEGPSVELPSTEGRWHHNTPVPSAAPSMSTSPPSDAPTVLDCPCFKSSEEIDIALDAEVKEYNEKQNEYHYYPTCKGNGSNYFNAALGKQDISIGVETYTSFATLLLTVNGYYRCSFSATHTTVDPLTPGQIEECKAIILDTKACSPDEN